MTFPSLDLTEYQTFVALRSFLIAVLPSDTEIIKGQDNRVPEPAETNFVVMTPILRTRLATNATSYTDAAFIGSIAITTLTVSKMNFGKIVPGRILFGHNVATGTSIVSQATGSPAGEVGTYVITPSQSVNSELLACGIRQDLQSTKVTIQLDVHGPLSADNIQKVTTLFRSSYGTDVFAISGYDVVPLYNSEPIQLPYNNGEQQIETRWIVDMVLQCNPIVTTPQQFADTLSPEIISVDATYPPE